MNLTEEFSIKCYKINFRWTHRMLHTSCESPQQISRLLTRETVEI